MCWLLRKNFISRSWTFNFINIHNIYIYMHIYYFIVFSFPISKKGPFYLRTYYHVNCLLWMALWLVKEHWEWCFLREKAEWHIFAFALLFVCHVFAAEDKRPEQERCCMQGIRYPGKPDFALYDCMRLAKHEGRLLHFSRIKQCRGSVWLFSVACLAYGFLFHVEITIIHGK